MKKRWMEGMEGKMDGKNGRKDWKERWKEWKVIMKVKDG